MGKEPWKPDIYIPDDILSIEQLYNTGLDVGYRISSLSQGSKKKPDPTDFFGTKFIFYIRVPVQANVMGDKILDKLITTGSAIIQFSGHIGYVDRIISNGCSNFCYDTEICMSMHHSYREDIENCSKEISRCLKNRFSALLSSRHIPGYNPPWAPEYPEGQD